METVTISKEEYISLLELSLIARQQVIEELREKIRNLTGF